MEKTKLENQLRVISLILKAKNMIVSSNINEVIRAVLTFLFFTKRFHTHQKAQKAQKRNQAKAQKCK